eukprot:jgi/Botrbrau1/2357/Bobra.39_1s0041.1
MTAGEKGYAYQSGPPPGYPYQHQQQFYPQGPPPQGFYPQQPPPQAPYVQSPQQPPRSRGCLEACLAVLCCCLVCDAIT